MDSSFDQFAALVEKYVDIPASQKASDIVHDL